MAYRSKISTAAKPKVSIIAISYNHENYIKQAFDSFVAQKTDFEYEIVVGDDCSTDSTQKIIDEYVTKYPSLFRQIKRKQNIGLQRNFANTLQNAKGQYLALCECDDYWTDPLKLQRQVNFLDKNPDYSVCFHQVEIIFEDHSKQNEIFPGNDIERPFSVEKLLERNFIQTNSVMYRRQDYKSLPIEILPVDWYLHLYNAQFGKIGFIDKVMAVYRRHDGGLWWAQYKNAEKIWEKYGYNFLILLHEIMLMYGDNSEYRKIINQHIAGSYEAISAIKPQAVSDRVAVKSIGEIPVESWDYMKQLIRQVKQAADYKTKLLEQEARLKEAVNQLQEIVDNEKQTNKLLADELHEIKTSKLWQALLKTRSGIHFVKHPVSSTMRNPWKTKAKKEKW